MERFNVYWLVLWINLLLAMLFIWCIQFILVYVFHSNFWRPEFYELLKDVYPGVLVKLKLYSFRTLINCITALTVIDGLIVWILLSNPRTITFMIVIPLFLLSLWCFIRLGFEWLNYGFLLMTGYKGIVNWMWTKIEPVIIKIESWENMLEDRISSFVMDFRENYTDLFLKIDNALFYLNLPLLKFPSEKQFIYLTICFFFTGFYLLSWGLVVYNRLVKFRDAMLLLAIYIFTFGCLFPWRSFNYLHPGFTLATYMFIPSVMNLFWVRTCLYISGIRLLKKVRLYFSQWNLREGNSTGHIFLSHLFLLGCVVLIPLLNMNNEMGRRISEEAFASRYLPTTLEELNRAYTDISPCENIANEVIEVYREAERIFSIGSDFEKWFYELCIQEMGLSADECYKIYGELPPYIGGSLLPIYESLSEIGWKITSGYYERYVKQITDRIKNIDFNKFKGSRYPLNLKAGENVPLSHLAKLRYLERLLLLDALVNFVNEDYTEMLKAFRASRILIDSLRNEPLAASQLVRRHLSGMTLDCFVWCVNHREIPKTVLRDMCEVIVDIRHSLENTNYELVDAFDTLAFLDTVDSPLSYWGKLYSVVDKKGIGELLDSRIYYISSYTMAEIEKTWFPLIDVFNIRGSEMITSLIIHGMSVEIKEKAFKFGNISFPEIEKVENFLNFFSSNRICFGITSPQFASFITPIASTRSILMSRTFIDMALYLAEIDLFVREYGRLPECLEEISSKYVVQVPIDPCDKYMSKIKYRKLEDGSCVIYSVSIDEIDNKGDIGRIKYNSQHSPDAGWALLNLNFRRNLNISSQ